MQRFLFLRGYRLRRTGLRAFNSKTWVQCPITLPFMTDNALQNLYRQIEEDRMLREIRKKIARAIAANPKRVTLEAASVQIKQFMAVW